MEALVVRVLPGGGAQVGHAHVGGQVPVGIEAVGGAVEEGEPREVRSAAGVVVEVGVERPTEVVGGSKSDLLLPTIAGPVVIESRVHCRLDRTVHCSRPRRRGRIAALVPSAACEPCPRPTRIWPAIRPWVFVLLM